MLTVPCVCACSLSVLTVICAQEAIELLISTDGFDVGYESETMVHEVAARFTKAAPALHSLGSALTSPPRTTAMQAESSGIANNVMARNIGLIVGNLSDIAGSLRTITELLGANPTRIKSALRTLQDGELVDSDDEDGERDSDDEPPATQRARKKRARPSAVAAAAAAADSDEGEVEMFDSQASTQPNPPSDLAAALARKSPPAGAAAAASAAPPPVRKAAAKSAKK